MLKLGVFKSLTVIMLSVSSFSFNGETKRCPTDDVRFDFTAKNVSEYREILVKVSVTLYNDNCDTVYFPSHSCDGTQYYLQYDNSWFDLYPIMVCNMPLHYIAKIPPHGRYYFTTYFKNRVNAKEMSLGFDFYKVDKDVDLKSNDRPSIWDKRAKNVIWATTHQIE